MQKTLFYSLVILSISINVWKLVIFNNKATKKVKYEKWKKLIKMKKNCLLHFFGSICHRHRRGYADSPPNMFVSLSWWKVSPLWLHTVHVHLQAASSLIFFQKSLLCLFLHSVIRHSVTGKGPHDRKCRGKIWPSHHTYTVGILIHKTHDVINGIKSNIFSVWVLIRVTEETFLLPTSHKVPV